MSWLNPEFIAPSIAGVFAIITATIAAVVSRRNAKNSAREDRAPDVQELWAQQERDRQARYTLETLLWRLLHAFESYFGRVQAGGSKELTAKEQAAIDACVPKREQ